MCSVGAGSVPRVGQAFGVGAGSRGLAGRQAVKRAAAPTGIVHALDAKRILRYAGLGGSRNVIDRPDSCCSEHRGEGYTDHFSAPSWLEGRFSFEPWATAWAGRAGDGTSLPDPVREPLGRADQKWAAPNRLFHFIVVASTQTFLDKDYSLFNRSLCKFGILSKDLQRST